MTKSDKQPLNKAEDSQKESAILRPHCCGHTFHPAEVSFMLFILAGVGMLVATFVSASLDNSLFRYVAGISYCASAAFALSLIWNLASIKRIAAAAEMLAGDVETFKQENQRARTMQIEKRRQDDDMKEKVGDLQKAQVLLKGSVESLEDIKKQEEDMLKDQMAMLESRRELCKKLQTDMEDLNEQTLAEAKEELHTRCTLYFEENDQDENGMEVGSTEWNHLEKLLNTNGIKISATAAGGDGHLSHEEFQEFLDDTLVTHFDELKKALVKNELLSEEIQEERIRHTR